MTRLDKSILDYVVIAIIPALIMLLVGSLVFFLLTVFHHGQYVARLHFIFAMFVMATVLIARISMNEGIEYAMLFAVPLAIAAGLAMWRFVAIEGPLAQLSPLINLGLLGLVWWSTHRLTWDCTLIDEHEDATGQGLLQTIGFDAPSPAEAQGQQPDEPTEESTAELTDESPTVTSPEAPPRGLWQRFVARQRRPHSPGVWVVYFSLAALPLFGLGQRQIPAADLSSRQYAFRLLSVYVASGLGLLLTTSFLGLRRYLRQRRVEMSNEMAKTWLVIGSVMIVLLMAFCTLLPRPAAEYSAARLPLRFGSPGPQRTSRLAPGHEGPSHQQQARRAGTETEQRGSSDEEKLQAESQRKEPQGSGQGKPSRQDHNVEQSSRSQPDSSAQTTSDRRRDDSSRSTKPSRDGPKRARP